MVVRTGDLPMTHDIWEPFGSEPHILIIRIVLNSGSVGWRPYITPRGVHDWSCAMRQLIPRLLRRLKERSVAGDTIRPIRPPAHGAKSLRRPLPPPPVFSGRSRSILLDEINPITKPKAYRRHKSLPPQVRLPDSQKTRTVSRDGTVEDDVRREMTAEEREWHANPYRMLRQFSLPVPADKATVPL